MPIQDTAQAAQLATEAADCCRQITQQVAQGQGAANETEIQQLANRARECCEQIQSMARS